jgi:hypothetical protein
MTPLGVALELAPEALLEVIADVPGLAAVAGACDDAAALCVGSRALPAEAALAVVAAGMTAGELALGLAGALTLGGAAPKGVDADSAPRVPPVLEEPHAVVAARAK